MMQCELCLAVDVDIFLVRVTWTTRDAGGVEGRQDDANLCLNCLVGLRKKGNGVRHLGKVVA